MSDPIFEKLTNPTGEDNTPVFVESAEPAQPAPITGKNDPVFQQYVTAPAFEMPPGNSTANDDPDYWLGGTDAIAASMPRDEVDRARVYSQKLFPDLEPAEAMSRMSIKDGRLTYYKDDEDGKGWHFAEPALEGIRWTSPKGLKDAGNWMADNAADINAVLLSVAGPVGMGVGATGIAATTAAVTFADVMRQLASHMDDTNPDKGEFSESYDPMQTGIEGGGELFGAVGGKLLGRWLQTTTRSDINKMISDPEKLAKMLALKEKADAAGIQLTPAELTGLRSLRRRQNLLFDMVGSDDILGEFAAARAQGDVPDAVARALGLIGPKWSSVDEGAELALQGATETSKHITKRRTAMADPYFKKAYETHAATGKVPNPLPLIEDLKAAAVDMTDEGAAWLEQAQRIISKPVMTGPSKGQPYGPVLERFDAARQNLWELQEKAAKAGDKVAAAKLRQTYFSLRQIMTNDAMGGSSYYGKALNVFKELSPEVMEKDMGATGRVAAQEAKGREFYEPMKAVKKLYDQGVRGVQRTRKQFETAGQLDQWNEGLRSFLQDGFDMATKRGQAAPATWARNLRLDRQFQEKMQSAMDPRQYHAFENLLEVIEATGTAGAGGSRTAPGIEEIANIKVDGRKKWRKVAGKAAQVFNPFSLVDRIALAIESGGDQQVFEAMAHAITSKDGVEALLKLDGISKGGEQAVVAGMQVLFDSLKGLGYAATSPTDKQTERQMKKLYIKAKPTGQ